MGLSLNLQLPTADQIQKQANQQYQTQQNKTNFANFMGSQLTGLISDGIGDAFGNSGIGRQVGNVFGNGLGSVGGTMLSNYLKGNTLMQGVSKNLGASLQGAASGLAADFAGKGVNALMGDSKLGNFAGGATSSALGQILGGGIGNPITFGANVLGSGLSSMLGPSKEYGGKYGNITQTMDSIYGGIQGAVGLFGPVGAGVSAAMALNKGLSNLFGSTDGMTKQDAILGSAFMPAPVKWLNAGLGKKTGSFDNQSWQNQEKANSFMQNGFGDLGERFDQARYEANKKYGLFSQHARRKAQRNIDFANNAWDQILAMADQNELQNIRSQYMSSINNQRYAQMLGGGLKPLQIGKQGMKIFNNQTNHNIGQRLLSAAALIDNKAMILSAQGGTKLTRQRPKPLPKKPATREENPELWDEWERREAERQAARQQVYDQERQAATQRAETNARHAQHYSNLATEIAKTAQQNAQFEPVTQESLQNSNTERLRQEQLADKNEYFDKGMDFINAAGMADLGLNVAGPIFQRSFRWALDKAGNLVKVPVQKTNQFLTSPYTGKWTQFGNREYRLSPNTLGANGVPVESRPVISEVNWDPDNWFKTISRRNSYSAEEAAELASHISEYREIEKRLFDEGKLIVNSQGNVIVKGSNMSPQEYIMRQSEAFQKMNSEHHYTGVPKYNMEYFEKNPVDVESWSDRISPKNVEEYAFGNFKTRKEILDNIKYLEDLENKNGITESTQDWLKIYRQQLEDFDANIKLMKEKNHGRVYDITYPDGLNTFNMDALGNHWSRIPSEIPAKAGVSRRYLRPGEVATDDIVYASNEIEPSIVNINNVMDTYDGTLLNETIIPRFVPKKSVLGNTGNFNLSNPSLFRSLMPLTVGGSTAATLYNTNK